jgi:hypothetical protein
MSYLLEIWYVVHECDKDATIFFFVKIGAAVGGILTAFWRFSAILTKRLEML